MESWPGPEPIITIITITYEAAALCSVGGQITAPLRDANYPHVPQQLATTEIHLRENPFFS